jgi:hypothetical protein
MPQHLDAIQKYLSSASSNYYDVGCICQSSGKVTQAFNLHDHLLQPIMVVLTRRCSPSEVAVVANQVGLVSIVEGPRAGHFIGVGAAGSKILEASTLRTSSAKTAPTSRLCTPRTLNGRPRNRFRMASDSKDEAAPPPSSLPPAIVCIGMAGKSAPTSMLKQALELTEAPLRRFRKDDVHAAHQRASTRPAEASLRHQP